MVRAIINWRNGELENWVDAGDFLKQVHCLIAPKI